jgi:hypothetical protein
LYNKRVENDCKGNRSNGTNKHKSSRAYYQVLC